MALRAPCPDEYRLISTGTRRRTDLAFYVWKYTSGDEITNPMEAENRDDQGKYV
jgi:hypothetical protein